MADDKLIEFRPNDLEVALKPWDGSRTCYCEGFWLEEKRRLLECRVCGKLHDPFDYLMKVGRQAANFMTGIERLQQELKQKHEELARLKGQVSNARATLRRATA